MQHEKHEAASGVFWLGCNRIISFFTAFLSGIVLARLLEPRDFGIVALATAVYKVLGQLSAIGVAPEIMRLEEDTPDYWEHISTYFWVNACCVVCAFGLGLFCVKATSLLTGQAWIVFTVVAFFWSCNNMLAPGRALLHKHMRFRAVALLDFLPLVIAAMISVVMAFTGWGIWSLFLPKVVCIFLASVVALRLSGFYPRMCFQMDRAKFLLKRGLWYVVNGFAAEGFLRIDDIMIGKILGSTVLGFYERAYLMTSMFHNNIGDVFNRTLMPFAFKHFNDEDKTQKLYEYSVKALIYTVFPLLTVFVLYCRELIVFLYGSKWMPTVFLFYVIAPYALMLPLFYLNKVFAISQDNVRQVGEAEVIKLVALAVLLVPLIHRYGAVGAAVAVNIAIVAGLIRIFFLVQKQGVMNLIAIYLLPVGISVFILLCSWGVKLLFYGKMPLYAVFGLNCFWLAVLLWAGLAVFEKPLMAFIKQVVFAYYKQRLLGVSDS